MAVTYRNIISNRRGCYFEVTGDGATTALTVSHSNSVHASTTATATVLTAASKFENGCSGKGGFVFPTAGTPVAVSSVSVAATSVTVNTGAAVGNGTKAYVAVVFNQDSATH
jgi:pyruvate/2-oxoacid:ferredoxin oxidoreductase beta subunit